MTCMKCIVTFEWFIDWDYFEFQFWPTFSFSVLVYSHFYFLFISLSHVFCFNLNFFFITYRISHTYYFRLYSQCRRAWIGTFYCQIVSFSCLFFLLPIIMNMCCLGWSLMYTRAEVPEWLIGVVAAPIFSLT